MKEILGMLATAELVDLLFSGKGEEKSHMMMEILWERIQSAAKKCGQL